MNILRRIFGPSTEAKDTTLSIDQVLSRMDLLRATAAGEPVTSETALNAPTILAIVRALASVLAMLPIDVIKGSGDDREELPNHELAWLLNRAPNTWQSRYDYWYTVAAQMILYGEFIAVKNQAMNGKLVNLIPIPPGMAMARLGDDFRMTYQITQRGGGTRTYQQREVHHIRTGTVDGVTPIRPIDRLREDIALEIACTKFGAALFGNGAIPNLVIEHPSHFMTQEAADRFKEAWTSTFKKKRGTAVLEDGMKLHEIQLANDESQFLETRKHQRNVIAGAFGVPPHRIGDLERATFSNIEQQSLEFVTYALMPYLVAIEAAVNRDLLPEAQKWDTAVKFNVDALLRGDAKSRAETLQIERQMGIINANEWRALTDRAPRTDPAGDDYMTPMNMSAGKSTDASKPDAGAGSNDQEETP